MKSFYVNEIICLNDVQRSTQFDQNVEDIQNYDFSKNNKKSFIILDKRSSLIWFERSFLKAFMESDCFIEFQLVFLLAQAWLQIQISGRVTKALILLEIKILKDLFRQELKDTETYDVELMNIDLQLKDLFCLKDYLSGSSGKQLWDIWLDFQRVNTLRNSQADLNLCLDNMKSIYISGLRGSKEVLLQLNLLQSKNWNVEHLIVVQNQIIQILITYWLPNFIQAKERNDKKICKLNYKEENTINFLNFKEDNINKKLFHSNESENLHDDYTNIDNINIKNVCNNNTYNIINNIAVSLNNATNTNNIETESFNINNSRFNNHLNIKNHINKNIYNKDNKNITENNKTCLINNINHLKIINNNNTNKNNNNNNNEKELIIHDNNDNNNKICNSNVKSYRNPNNFDTRSVSAQLSRNKSNLNASSPNVTNLMLQKSKSNLEVHTLKTNNLFSPSLNTLKEFSCQILFDNKKDSLERKRDDNVCLLCFNLESMTGKWFQKFLEKLGNKQWLSCLIFWQDCKKFEDLFQQEILEKYLISRKAQQIYARHLGPDAEYIINYFSELSEEILFQLNNPTRNMFSDAFVYAENILINVWNLFQIDGNSIIDYNLEQNEEISGETLLKFSNETLMREMFTLDRILLKKDKLLEFERFLETNDFKKYLELYLDIKKYKTMSKGKYKLFKAYEISEKFTLQIEELKLKYGNGEINKNEKLSDSFNDIHVTTLLTQKLVRNYLERKLIPTFINSRDFSDKWKLEENSRNKINNRDSKNIAMKVSKTKILYTNKIEKLRNCLRFYETKTKFISFLKRKNEQYMRDTLFWIAVQKFKTSWLNKCNLSPKEVMKEEFDCLINSFIKVTDLKLSLSVPYQVEKFILLKEDEKLCFSVFGELESAILPSLLSNFKEFLLETGRIEDENSDIFTGDGLKFVSFKDRKNFNLKNNKTLGFNLQNKSQSAISIKTKSTNSLNRNKATSMNGRKTSLTDLDFNSKISNKQKFNSSKKDYIPNKSFFFKESFDRNENKNNFKLNEKENNYNLNNSKYESNIKTKKYFDNNKPNLINSSQKDFEKSINNSDNKKIKHFLSLQDNKITSFQQKLDIDDTNLNNFCIATEKAMSVNKNGTYSWLYSQYLQVLESESLLANLNIPVKNTVKKKAI